MRTATKRASAKTAPAKTAPAKTAAAKTAKTASSKTTTNPALAHYEKLLATIPEIERKGDANPYTSLNGNMFTLLHQSQLLAIRLPESARTELLKKHNAKVFEAYGAVMKEYVAVPDTLLANTQELRKYLQLSYEYAKTLKPKATKKK